MSPSAVDANPQELGSLVMWPFLAAMSSMFLKDSIGTCLVVCEARGKAQIAGGLAAVSDLAGVLVTITSAGLVIQQGWTLKTGGIIAAMMVTSAFGTWFWTKMSNRIAQKGEQGLQADHAPAQVPELSRRIAALEEKVGK